MTDNSKKSKTATIIQRFTGKVISDKMDKTIVVKVAQTKIHPRYHKRYTISRHFKVHDEKNQFKINDSVTFAACRPISRDKKWRVIY